jgi:Fe-S-cluster-containing hydrogenase component 2
MEEDEKGFEYPRVDKTKCVGCYSCLKVCPLK